MGESFLNETGEGLVLEGRATDHKAKILIMEDDPALVRLLSLNLEGEGYTVHSAGDGLEGLRLAFEEKPDLVVLDIMMPVMDGWGVCQGLREISDAPILMLTCCGDLRDKVRGLSMGADDYLPKPFDMQELLLRIEALLRRSRWRPYVAKPTTFDDGNLLVDLDGTVTRPPFLRSLGRVESSTAINAVLCYNLAQSIFRPLSGRAQESPSGP